MTGVRVSRAGCITTITLDEPKSRNALSSTVRAGLLSGLRECEKQGVRVVIITGSGPAFCAGGDLKAMPEDENGGAEFIRGVFEWFEAVRHCRLPVIAAVNGPAMGGGAELVLACDLAVAAETAIFGFPETQVGLMAPFAAARLPVMLPPAVGRELAMTGRVLSATEAAALGIVNAVVPPGQLLSAATTLAERIAERSALATEITKSLHNLDGRVTAEDAARTNAALFASTDTRGRIQDFIASRRGKRPSAEPGAYRVKGTTSQEAP
jgi:enoyl-CoA hydratase/carnithine racemase